MYIHWTTHNYIQHNHERSFNAVLAPTSRRPKPLGFPASSECKPVLSRTLRDPGFVESLTPNSTVFRNIFLSRYSRLLSLSKSFLPPSCAPEVIVLTGGEYSRIRTSRFRLIYTYELLHGMVHHVNHVHHSVCQSSRRAPTQNKC